MPRIVGMKEETPHYEFDSYRIEIAQQSLYNDGEVVPLSSNEFALLLKLIEKRGETVSKRELSKVIRGGQGTRERDETVTRYISNIRARLGDSPRKEQPKYIRSFSKRGYQFIYQNVREVGIKRSIAVAPFKNLSAEKRELNLGSWMAEVLSATLINIKEFHVIPSSEYSSLGQNPSGVNEQPGKFVVSGSVMLTGRKVRVIAYLQQSDNEERLWSQMYTEAGTDILKALESISRKVTEELPAAISGDKERFVAVSSNEGNHSRNRRINSIEAHKLYEEGWSYLNQRTPDALIEGLKYFEKAVKKDPSFGAAYVGVADCNLLLSIFGSEVIAPKKGMPKAKAAALTALGIDETLAEAHASLASVKFLFDRDWAGAEKEFRAAIRYNPDYATARQFFAHNLALMGRNKEALAQIKKAHQLNASPIINATVSRIYYLGRQYKHAVEAAQYAIKRHRRFFLGYVFLGIVYKQLDRLPEALEQFYMARNFDSTPDWGNPATLGELGHTLALLGKVKEARRVIKDLEDMSKRHYVGPVNLAKIYMGLEDTAQTFNYLEETFDHRSAWLLTFKVDPVFDRIRMHPQFQDLLRRIGLPE